MVFETPETNQTLTQCQISEQQNPQSYVYHAMYNLLTFHEFVISERKQWQ